MRGALLVPLLLAVGCGEGGDPVPRTGDDSGPTPPTERPGAVAGFTNRVWWRSDPAAPPGAMVVFLDDGTLVQDSCWETYRLSRWRMDPDGTLAWSEDGAEIHASVLTSTEDALSLRLRLVGGSEDRDYGPATVPYVCPDLPR